MTCRDKEFGNVIARAGGILLISLCSSFGSIDAKVTDQILIRSGAALAVSGPTWDVLFTFSVFHSFLGIFSGLLISRLIVFMYYFNFASLDRVQS